MNTSITLNKDVAEKNNVTIAELLLLISIENNFDLVDAENLLITKGYITANRSGNSFDNKWRVTLKGKHLIDTIIIESDKNQVEDNRLTNLATQLKKIFPEGKKDGTNLYWTEGIVLIERRLKTFFKKYGNDFNDEDIINAAQSYVDSFNGNYRLMRVLKYFIFKEKKNDNGEIESESDLINYIENAGQVENLKNDWTSTIN